MTPADAETIDLMRYNLRTAVAAGIFGGSVSLDIAAKLAACSMAEDMREIRRMFERAEETR